MEIIYTSKIVNKQNIKTAAYTTLYYSGLLVVSTLMLVGITFLCFG